jgi:hypothetical protein
MEPEPNIALMHTTVPSDLEAALRSINAFEVYVDALEAWAWHSHLRTSEALDTMNHALQAFENVYVANQPYLSDSDRRTIVRHLAQSEFVGPDMPRIVAWHRD